MDFQLNLNSETVEQAHPIEPVCVDPQQPVAAVLAILKEKNLGCALVCENEKLVGIFTERDALKMMAAESDLNTPIGEVMVKDPATLSASDTVGTAISRMSTGGYRRLPIVTDDQKPVGLLKVPGILHYLVEHFPSVIYTLPPKPGNGTENREGA